MNERNATSLMNLIGGRPWSGIVAVLVMYFSAFGLSARDAIAAEPMSIQELVEQSARWPQIADAKTRLTVAGRWASVIAGSSMRFQKCDLLFRARNGLRLPRPQKEDGIIEVTGTLLREAGNFVFVVASMREFPGDLEAVRTRKRLLPDDESQPWYELGRWAAGRAEFYEDAELADEAVSLVRQGIELDRRNVPPENWGALKALAVKAGTLGLPKQVQDELVHEAYHRRWQAMTNPSASMLKKLLTEFEADFPASVVPLDPPQPELRETYANDPQGVYRTATAEHREKLQRMFYSNILLASIEQSAAVDGSNGVEIAKRIDAEIPEFHSFADKYAVRELEFRQKNIAAMTLPELQDFVREMEKRDRKQPAQQIQRDWVALRVDQLRKQGALGLERAAELVWQILEDREQAAELLQSAYEKNPESTTIAELFVELGYQRQDEKWGSAEQANRDGQPATGNILRVDMTRDEVRRAMGGQPVKVTRVATGSKIIEVWTYANLTVQFERRNRASDSEPKVVAFR